MDEGDALSGEAQLAKYREACQKFEESRRLNSSVGALANLGLCHKNLGQIASAWLNYDAAANLAEAQGQTQRALTARQEAKALRPRVSQVTVNVTTELPGMTVTRNGADVVIGVQVPTDPGEYVFEVAAEGYASWSQTVTIGTVGQDEKLLVPELVAGGAGGDNDSPTSTLAVVGYSLVGGGAILVGVGTAFGILAIQGIEDLEAKCPGGTCVDQEGSDLIKSTEQKANISTVGIALGAAAAAAGIVLVVIAPDEPAHEAAQVIPTFGPTSVGLSLQGTF